MNDETKKIAEMRRQRATLAAQLRHRSSDRDRVNRRLQQIRKTEEHDAMLRYQNVYAKNRLRCPACGKGPMSYSHLTSCDEAIVVEGKRPHWIDWQTVNRAVYVCLECGEERVWL